MIRASLLAALGAAFVPKPPVPAKLAVAVGAVRAVVYRDRGCGCCEGWVAALKREGYRVDLIDVERAVRLRQFGVPDDLSSCHTAIVGGYILEGHVPMGALAKIFREQPKTRGFALPGMPSGTPGMPGLKVPLKVVVLDKPSQVFYSE